MNPIKISQEMYQAILNAPGATFQLGNGVGYCALGKVMLAVGSVRFSPSAIPHDLWNFIANNNNHPERITFGREYVQPQYKWQPKTIMPGDAQWAKHQEFTKLAFQAFESAGVLQIEEAEESLESKLSREVKSRGLLPALTSAIQEAAYALAA